VPRAGLELRTRERPGLQPGAFDAQHLKNQFTWAFYHFET
jgi:hypothetical protein